MAKKKTRRPERAERRAAARGGPQPPAPARAASMELGPSGLRSLSQSHTGWRSFLPESAASILERERPVAELFRQVPADEPMWTWWEDLEADTTEDLVRDDYPHLGDAEVAVLVAEMDAETEQNRAAERRRFAELCDALGLPEPVGTFADLHQFCLKIGIAEERPVNGKPWVFPVPRDVLDVLPTDSALAAAERAARKHATADAAWESDLMEYGEYTELIIDLFRNGASGEPVMTSIERLTRLLDAPEDTARRALAHLTSSIPLFGRSHIACTADPLTVPAHRVITISVDWEAHDTDKGFSQGPAQLAGVVCTACVVDYRTHPERAQVVLGLAGDPYQPHPRVVCQGICAAEYGSVTGTGQPVPPIEDRLLYLKQLDTERSALSGRALAWWNGRQYHVEGLHWELQ